jgi:hypothetical protein
MGNALWRLLQILVFFGFLAANANWRWIPMGGYPANFVALLCAVAATAFASLFIDTLRFGGMGRWAAIILLTASFIAAFFLDGNEGFVVLPILTAGLIVTFIWSRAGLTRLLAWWRSQGTRRLR